MIAALKERRARKRHGALTRDRCEVCGKLLRERERVEVTDSFDMETTEVGLGGGAVSATYCKEHAP